MTTYNAYQGNTKIHHIYNGANKVYYIYKGNRLVWRDRHYDKNQTIFEQAVGGDYTFTILDDGIYEITCVGAGGAAGYRSWYDHTGYLSTGGSASAIVGNVALTHGVYNIHVGSNTRTNGNDGTVGDIENSYIDGVVKAYAGGNGFADGYSHSIGAGGAIPTQILEFSDISLNTAGNNGVYGTGGKGSASNFSRPRTVSVYAPDLFKDETIRPNARPNERTWTVNTNYGAGAGGAGSVSEYDWRTFILRPMPGLVKIVYKRDL